MSDPFIGEIKAFGFNFAPRGWALCNGQILPINQNTALFSLLGNIYGGDGRTTFALPDLRGRAPIHFGQGPGLSYFPQGIPSGVESVTLTATEMPSHTHNITMESIQARLKGVADEAENKTISASSALAQPETAEIYSNETPTVEMNPESISISGSASCLPTGGSLGHYNVSPCLAVNWCIALTGIFPSRS
ncbi:MAG: phage tail protein [Deltaproteobacteria bacterium]|nr:phage tail protein [Deltaproteobacteria bacterium]